MKYTYDAELVRVIDGDTFVCNIDLGFSIHIFDIHIRMYGVNAPELKTQEGKIAKEYLIKVLPKTFVLQTIKDKTEKYGRMLGIVGNINNDLQKQYGTYLINR